MRLDATAAFAGLTTKWHKEKNYAMHLGRADWEGAKICLLQCSPEVSSRASAHPQPLVWCLAQQQHGAMALLARRGGAGGAGGAQPRADANC